MQAVKVNSHGEFTIGPGTLYGSIKRMLADDLIAESEERPDPELDDQRRRYYRLTDMAETRCKPTWSAWMPCCSAPEPYKSFPLLRRRSTP